MTTRTTAVIGAGNWGTALAKLIADRGSPVTMWAYEREVVEGINERHENPFYLQGERLPEGLRATGELAEALRGAEVVLLAPPSHVFRDVLGAAAKHVPAGAPLMIATKGIEEQSCLIMTEVAAEILGWKAWERTAVLSGPSFAKELARGDPTAVSLACRNLAVAEDLQRFLSGDVLRAYATEDVVGVSLGGAVKNVIAIAVGAATGLGLGHNSRAALMTRGIAEITRLVLQRGGNALTLAGLSGIGDLVLTCTSELSRNRQVGEALGRGEKLKDWVSRNRQVAEGVHNARSVRQLSQRAGVEMPISELVYRALYEELPPAQAIGLLMGRTLRHERDEK
ncbi:MAG: NAD(P)-dependent glycerol-3-phosphate dehydrogenase [Deltaproteobacteria bacterium]|nr:NAD(P)-dependent glycerol-3-phosphate dehydrogenase [Deltaproteobacteria bacterium]